MTTETTNLETLVSEYLAHNAKFESGVNAAGSRARKSLQAIGVFVKERRKAITEEKAARAAAK
jgi:hypothetical protein